MPCTIHLSKERDRERRNDCRRKLEIITANRCAQGSVYHQWSLITDDPLVMKRTIMAFTRCMSKAKLQSNEKLFNSQNSLHGIEYLGLITEERKR